MLISGGPSDIRERESRRPLLSSSMGFATMFVQIAHDMGAPCTSILEHRRFRLRQTVISKAVGTGTTEFLDNQTSRSSSPRSTKVSSTTAGAPA